jgi:Holliday junction resolvase RusA-like endonuclease
MIELTIPGQPVPQPRHKVSTWGGRGRAYIEARHPIHAYKQAAQLVARSVISKPLDGWLVVDIEAVFARPPSHRTKTGLSKSAPAFPPVGDWDNLGKGVCDAIQEIAYLNDSQIVDGRCRKRYAEPGELPRTIVTIREA